MNIFTQFFTKVSANPQAKEQAVIRDLIRRESTIGREVFGPVPAGHKREFFCLDENTWVWHETWKDAGVQKTRVTRYAVRNHDIVKSVNNGAYQSVSLQEADNLRRAAKLYLKRINKNVYGQTVR